MKSWKTAIYSYYWDACLTRRQSEISEFRVSRDEQHRFGVEQRSKLWKKNDSTTRFGNDCHSYSADTRNEFV
jgi:hypothetical protein